MIRLSKAPKNKRLSLRRKGILYHGSIRNIKDKDKDVLPIYQEKELNSFNLHTSKISNISTKYVFQSGKNVIRITGNGNIDRTRYDPESGTLYVQSRCSGIGILEKTASKH